MDDSTSVTTSAPSGHPHPDPMIWEHIRRECCDLKNGRVELIFHQGRLVRWELVQVRLAHELPRPSGPGADLDDCGV